MATMQDVKRRLTIEATTRGVKEAAQDARALAGSMDGVAVAAQRQERATQSAESRLNSIQRRYDAAWRSQQQMVRIERDLMTAQAQGIVSQQRRLELLSMAAERHGLATAAINRETAAIDQQTIAVNRLAAANDNESRFRRRNLMYQAFDIGQTAALGMNPAMIAMQQGPQIAQLYAGQGGVNAALKDTAQLLGGVATRFGPIAVAAGVAALAVKGIQTEINATSDVMVSFGDVAWAIPQLIGSAIYDLLQPAIQAIAPWFMAAWDAIIQATRDLGNFIIRDLTGTFHVIRAAVDSLAPAFTAAGEAAANGFITAINWMVEKAVAGINIVIAAMNDMIEFMGGDAIGEQLGFDMTIGEIEAPTLGKLDLGGEQAVRDLNTRWTELQETLAEIGETDFMGRIFGAIQQQAIANATKRIEENEEALAELKREMEGFLSLADRLAEEMFPGNAAAAEAAELLDLMSRFGDELTDIQRIAVEARIEEMFMASALGVRELTEETNRAGKSLTKAMDPVKNFFDGLLDVLSSSGDAFDKLISLAAQMGKQFAQMGLDRLWEAMTGVGQGKGTSGRGSASAWPDMAGGGRGFAMEQASASRVEASIDRMATTMSVASDDLAGNIGRAANLLGTSAHDLATVISFETGGTFDPDIRGGAGNRHIGLIQFGPEEQRKYGAAIGQTLTAQMDAVVRYLQDRGFKPGMTGAELYATINTGSPGTGNRSDAANGGTWGSANDKWNYQMDGHRANADRILGPQEMRGAVKGGLVDFSQQQPAANVATASNAGGGGWQDLLGGNMKGLMAGVGAFAGGMQSGDPIGGAISGGLGMLGAGFGAVGIIGGAVLGLIGGLIGRARQKKEELKKAQQELEQQMGAITELIATATGNFMGTFEKTVMSTADEFSKAIAMANKAKNQELVDELTAAQDEFFDRMTDRWERGFEGMIASMEAGLGLDSEFMSGMDAVEKMRESLVGFINDARLFADAEGDLASVIKNRKDRFNAGDEEEIYRFAAEYNPGSNDAGALVIQNDILEGYKALGDQIADLGVQAYTKTGGMLYDSLDALRTAAEAAGLAIDEMGVVTEAAVDPNANLADNIEKAQKAAQATALAMLSGAEEFTAMEEAEQKLRGTRANMLTLLTDLGMTTEEASQAISDHFNIAMAKLRDAYRDELNSSINDLSGFGFINEIVSAMDRYDERLKDSAVLGLDGGLALRELNLALADIVETSDLTQEQIDMLAAAWPAMAGLIETVAGKDAMQLVQDAEAALRSAYEEQRREIEATISRLENFTDRIKEFRDEMRLSASSPLGQRDQMEEALKQFRETAALA
ncbi:phage tail length tape measure family protein, partial [Mesorhizobium sp. CAU 1741]|uniref:phage tail length tape measure family protein n=1 Tax=Mesorhizobium sp. CAU 1741 TaxID=3140366 RepID=UPI00325B5C8D